MHSLVNKLIHISSVKNFKGGTVETSIIRIIQQYGQCTFNVKFRSVRVTTVAVGRQ